MKHEFIGYVEALAATLGNIAPLETETVNLAESPDRIVARDLFAFVDSPSVDASLKDGFAVRSENIETATDSEPEILRLVGTSAAGIPFHGKVDDRCAVRILTGGRIPERADAVVSEEFTETRGDQVVVRNNARKGRNIFQKGKDVACGECVVKQGTRLSPGIIGLLAAAGHSGIPVYKRPNVSMIATGDEVVMPGKPLPEGKLYASNLATLNAWCRRYGLTVSMNQVADDRFNIASEIERAMKTSDALITSGGAWTGDRDLVVAILSDLGWTPFFHRIRIGPGKAVGFGLLSGKPVFVLPGGPPSNLLAFLAIALPGLMKLSGWTGPVLPEIPVTVGKTLTVRDKNWTQFVFGTLSGGHGADPVFTPLELDSRLRSMALAKAVVAVPEGVEILAEGTSVMAWNLL